MKIQRYPHLFHRTQLSIAVVLPIILVSELLTMFSASSFHNKQNYFSENQKKRRTEEERDHLRPHRKSIKKKFQACLIHKTFLVCFIIINSVPLSLQT